MKKTFVLGDPHGSLKAIKQVLERAKFNYDKDRLICLGDIADGWDETADAIEELLKIKDLIFILGNHDCLSTDTECLTENGWKKYNEINESDHIYSLDVKTGLGSWDKINKIIIKESTSINSLKNRHIDISCTDNHRILVKKRVSSNWKEFDYIPMNKLKGRYKIPVSAKNSVATGIELSDDEIRICAWILTDGGIRRVKKNHTGSYNIYQSKFVDHIRELLIRIGYKFSEYSSDRIIQEICGKKIKKQKKKFIFSILGDSAKKVKSYLPNKYPFPTFLFKMSNKQFKVFFKEILLADGNCYDGRKNSSGNCFILYGKYEKLSNFQALCVANGMRAVLVMDNRGDYRLNVSKYKFTELDTYGKIIRKEVTSKVWCLSVPKTNFMVRRNGKAFFTGNSWLMDWLEKKEAPLIWTKQGGKATIKSYKGKCKLKKKHLKFLKSCPYYFIDKDNRCFVHGGIKSGEHPSKTPTSFLTWDRDMWLNRYTNMVDDRFGDYEEVFIGHTSIYYDYKKPNRIGNVWFMDTGGGWEGKLSIMDVNSKRIFQSDKVDKLHKKQKEKIVADSVIKQLSKTI